MSEEKPLGQIAYEAYRIAFPGEDWGTWALIGDSDADNHPGGEAIGQAVAAHLGALECTPLPEPQPAPDPSALGLKHAVTSNRLGCALAALREIAEPRSDEFPRDTARNALADDAAIRDGVALTRERQPAPGGDLRAVIDMIWRICQKPDGERLAERIAGLIKNSGMEPF